MNTFAFLYIHAIVSVRTYPEINVKKYILPAMAGNKNVQYLRNDIHLKVNDNLQLRMYAYNNFY